MTKSILDRQRLQDGALIIESLLDAATAYFSVAPEESLPILEIAQERAARLNASLDSVNTTGVRNNG